MRTRVWMRPIIEFRQRASNTSSSRCFARPLVAPALLRSADGRLPPAPHDYGRRMVFLHGRSTTDLDKFGVPQPEQNEIKAIVESTHGAIVVAPLQEGY